MNIIETMKQALEALEWMTAIKGDPTEEPDIQSTITNLRAAIAEAKKCEPVAWRKIFSDKWSDGSWSYADDPEVIPKIETWEPLYPHPPLTAPAKCEPVGECRLVQTTNETSFDAVFYAPAIIDGRVEHGTKLYTRPLLAEPENLDELAVEVANEIGINPTFVCADPNSCPDDGGCCHVRKVDGRWLREGKIEEFARRFVARLK